MPAAIQGKVPNDSLFQSTKYNSLRTISEAEAAVPFDKDHDRYDLLSLFVKHRVPSGISLRLVHKHFDAVGDEVMVFQTVECAFAPKLQIMRPVRPTETIPLRGLHYLVGESGVLEPYEYTTTPGPDMSSHSAFLEDFVRVVVERGLQQRWGLKLSLDGGTAYSEFEVSEKRSTIMIPLSVELPPIEYERSVITDWQVSPRDNYISGSNCIESRSGGHFGTGGNCLETRSSHYPATSGEVEVHLAGVKLKYGTPAYHAVRSAILAL